MEKRRFLAEIGDLITSLEGASGPAATIRDDLRQTQELLNSCWNSERKWVESTIQSLFALGLVANLPVEALPPDDPLPPGLLERLQGLIEASREMSLVEAEHEG